MRGLLFIVAAIFLLALVGWISFSNTPDHSSINLETSEIKQDTQKMIDSGEQLIHRAQEPDRTAPVQPAPAQTAPAQTQPVETAPNRPAAEQDRAVPITQGEATQGT